MSNVKFSQLPNLSTITAPTFLPVVDSSINYTVTMANVTSYVNSNSTDITAGGNVSAVGNVTGAYVLGDGSLLTGLPAAYTDANVVTLLADFGSDTISTTGNITGGYILGDGSQLTGLPATYGNANVTTLLAAFGSNTISTTGNIRGGYILGNGSQLTGITTTYGNANVVTLLAGFGSNTISTTGNVTSGNIKTGGIVSATGNITGNYLLGNGSQLTGLPATYSNANVVTLMASFGSNVISTTGNITGGYVLGNGSQLTGVIAVGGNTISNGYAFANTATSGNVLYLYNGDVATPFVPAGNAISIQNYQNGRATAIYLGADGNININANTAVNINNAYFGVSGTQTRATTTGFSTDGSVTGNVVYANSVSVTGNIISSGVSVTTSIKIPVATKSGSSSGTQGQISADASYLYVCTASNVWKRVALTAF